mmetsp:Transcript_32225/g.102734  ORF Transcript_32225/g.102734 Transcript_32225/m.102734 type:complete len:270 (+) Transcript_32225:410-1219(+)
MGQLGRGERRVRQERREDSAEAAQQAGRSRGVAGRRREHVRRDGGEQAGGQGALLVGSLSLIYGGARSQARRGGRERRLRRGGRGFAGRRRHAARRLQAARRRPQSADKRGWPLDILIVAAVASGGEPAHSGAWLRARLQRDAGGRLGRPRSAARRRRLRCERRLAGCEDELPPPAAAAAAALGVVMRRRGVRGGDSALPSARGKARGGAPSTDPIAGIGSGMAGVAARDQTARISRGRRRHDGGRHGEELVRRRRGGVHTRDGDGVVG